MPSGSIHVVYHSPASNNRDGGAQMGEASSRLKASASRRSGVDTMVRTCGHDAPRERRSGRAEGRLGSVSRGQVGGAGLGLQDVP